MKLSILALITVLASACATVPASSSSQTFAGTCRNFGDGTYQVTGTSTEGATLSVVGPVGNETVSLVTTDGVTFTNCEVSAHTFGASGDTYGLRGDVMCESGTTMVSGSFSFEDCSY